MSQNFKVKSYVRPLRKHCIRFLFLLLGHCRDLSMYSTLWNRAQCTGWPSHEHLLTSSPLQHLQRLTLTANPPQPPLRNLFKTQKLWPLMWHPCRERPPGHHFHAERSITSEMVLVSRNYNHLLLWAVKRSQILVWVKLASTITMQGLYEIHNQLFW